MAKPQKFYWKLWQNVAGMKQVLPVDESFDLIQRDIRIGGREASFYFVDGMLNDEALLKILDSILKITPEEMPEDADQLIKKFPYSEVETIEEFDQAVRMVLSGMTVMFVDGYCKAIQIDCRTYPVRSVEEPDMDKSLRGSKDGFVETVVFDTALIRRRIRDPNLIMEIVEVGTSSRSDVVLCYMKNLIDPKLLETVRERIQAIDTPDLCMNQQSLAEALIGTRWYNPFPKFKFTERPDTAAACIMEGKLTILVDNAPSAMILPTSIFDMIEEANDYYFPAWTSLYLKISRVLILIVTVFLTPVYLLLMQNPQWVPPLFDFVLIRDTINIPLIWQLLILELAIDGLRLAALNTPNMLSTPLSIFAGLVLGEFAVTSGWFNTEVMLYMAFVAVANYTQPNFELGYAVKFMRMMILILTAVFGVYGFIAGCIILLLLLCTNKTLSGRNYLNVKLN
ncbi:MAG: spore germination protein [Lachnospiraceae bacterium]|nr:spore germination protein [Lachnospiraceae bacterium]